MTVSVSSLVVRPDIDASKFVGGARDIAAAQQQMAAGARTVSVEMANASDKITVAGDPVAKLNRQFVAGYADMTKFTGGIRQLNSALESGKLQGEQAQSIYAGMVSKLNIMADATDLARKGYAQLATVIGSVNEQMARMPTSSTLPARLAANSNVRPANSFAAFNAGQQLQDIAMMSLLGQSPMTTALQQGPQLATAIEQGGGLAALKGGLAALISPTTLVTVALTAAGAAAVQFGASIINQGKSVEDVLKKHKEIIDEIAAAYPRAAAAAKSYDEEASKAPLSVLSADTVSQLEDERKKVASTLGDLSTQLKVTGGDYGLFGDAGSKAFSSLADEIRAGKVDAIGLQSRLGSLRLDPTLSDVAHEFAQTLQESANQAALLERHLQGTGAAAKSLAGDFNGPGGLPILLQPGAGNASRSGAISDRDTELARMQRSFSASISSLSARSPQERAEAARQQAATDVVKGEDPLVRQMRIEQAGKIALAQADKQLSDAAKDRAFSIEQEMDQQQLQIMLIGKTAAEQARMNSIAEGYEKLKEESYRNGTPFDLKELATVRAKADALAAYVDEANSCNFDDEQPFERSIFQ